MENRIFASTFYWLGKQLASTCPYESDEMFKDRRIFAYFQRETEAFFRQFPNLHANVDDVKQQRDGLLCIAQSPLNFAKANARSGFKRFMGWAKK